MKQLLAIGNNVDDGTGDYLRKGGIKINDNFNELFNELGDGNTPHPAGSWKHIDSRTTQTLTAAFGKSYTVDTTQAPVSITLPKGTVADYNKVIRIRDVHSSWKTNPVRLNCANTDTIKGNGRTRQLRINYMDVELVYCYPGRWEFVEGKQVDRINNGDMATVSRKEFIATEGQVDFINVFGDQEYNTSAIEVYHKGNLLYYGDTFSNSSDYGSPAANSTNVLKLDGRSIRLRQPCKAGDVVTVVTYIDGVAQYRSSYNKLTVRILDSTKTHLQSIPGSRIVDDLDALTVIPFSRFGYEDHMGVINPHTLEVTLNGTLLQESGTADSPLFVCEGADAINQRDCVAAGGVWVENPIDYRIDVNTRNLPVSLTFGIQFKHGDVVTIRWYNNDIGTLLQYDDLQERFDDRYIAQNEPIALRGLIRLTNYTNPGPKDIESEPDDTFVSGNISHVFDMMYPIGTIYENAVNPNNPASYMGFGTWILWGQDKTLVGWSNNPESRFNENNNDLNDDGVGSSTAGGTGGEMTITLDRENIPSMTTDDSVLVVDKNGPIIVGGCLLDPDQGPAYTKYTERTATIEKTNNPPIPFDNMPPYVTVYRWLRVN